MTALERLKEKIPEASDGSKDELLYAYLDDAEDYILNTTNRSTLPRALVGAQVQLAIIYYNRQGMEGEQSRSTGGVSRSLFAEEVPPTLQAQIKAYRLLEVARRTHETAGEG